MNRFRLLWAVCLPLILIAFAGSAQPTLPDISGNNEGGVVILSWVCQFEGVKSVGVRRSADSNFNFSTIGYVRNVQKGVQAYADGRPMPGRNFYKLSIVFNSGLTWSSNFIGVNVDSASISRRRQLPTGDALQKLLSTETEHTPKPVKKTESNAVQHPSTVAPGDVTKYMEIPPAKKTTAGKRDSVALRGGKVNSSTPKVTINNIPAAEVPATIDTTPHKRIVMTFDDKDEATTFMDNMARDQKSDIVVTINDTAAASNTPAKKKIVLTFKDEEDARNYIESIKEDKTKKITLSFTTDTTLTAAVEKAPPPRPRITLRFPDESAAATTADVRSRYISVDPVTGHVSMHLPEDVHTRNYSIKFFDKENKAVIDVPRVNAASIVMDKRNFQKKGQYKFTIRKDGLELETGYITIY